MRKQKLMTALKLRKRKPGDNFHSLKTGMVKIACSQVSTFKLEKN